MTIETYNIGVTFDVRHNLRFEVEATSPLTAISKVSDMIEARSGGACNPGEGSKNSPRDSSMHINAGSDGMREEDPGCHPLDHISNYGITDSRLLAGDHESEENPITPENFGDGFDVKYRDCLIYGSHWIKPPNAEIPNIDITDPDLRVYFRN